MKTLVWDIETSPITAYTWGLWQQNVSISQIVESTSIMCVAAKWHRERSTMFLRGPTMIPDLWALLDEADVSVTYNGIQFDQKQAHREFVEAGMPKPSPYASVDLLRVVKSQFRFPSNKLDYVVQQLGIGGKTHHTGFQLWIDCMAGDEKAWKLMERYNRNDVRITEKLYDRLLPWIPNHPSVPLHDGLESGCPRCGSLKAHRRGFSYTSASKFQRYLCMNCQGWYRDSTRIGTTTGRQP
jgi:hypothetical protein